MVHGGKAMTENTQNAGRRRWRIARWSAAALLLLLPLVAMQFTAEVDWSVADFVVFGALLAGIGGTYELALSRRGPITYRAAVGVALAATFFLVWLSLGVGVIGRDGDPANLMYAGVLALGIGGAILARGRPRGMARAMVATACAQVLVAVIALLAGLGTTTPNWPLDILGLTGFFTALWLLSAWLFRNAPGERLPVIQEPDH
jgi:hypothetical protein